MHYLVRKDCCAVYRFIEIAKLVACQVYRKPPKEEERSREKSRAAVERLRTINHVIDEATVVHFSNGVKFLLAVSFR